MMEKENINNTIEDDLNRRNRNWDKISGLISDVDDLSSDVDGLISNVDDLINYVGDLETLTTDEKSNIVGALNEIDSNIKTHMADYASSKENLVWIIELIEAMNKQDDYALSFENGDYVNLGDVLSSITQSTPFGLELWIKTTKFGYQALITNQMPGPTGNGIQLGLGAHVGNVDAELFLRLQGEGGSGGRLQCGMPYNLNTGDWEHLVALYDGRATTSSFTFFHNGIKKDVDIHFSGTPQSMVSTNPTYLAVRNETEIPFEGCMDEVKIWIGTLPSEDHINFYKDKKPNVKGYKLFNNTKKKFDSQAFQGVATDSQYIYTTNSKTINKYTLAGSLVGSFTHSFSGYKYEDFCVVDDIAYVPLTNHPVTNPRLGKIQKINVVNMNLIETIDLDEKIHPASLAFKDDKFWMTVTEDASIYVYNENFELQKTYTFPVLGEQDATWPGYSGLEWIGDYLYGNKHGGGDRGLDVAKYNKELDTFIAVGAFNHVDNGTTQGITYDNINKKVYWAARGRNNEVWESDLTGGLVNYWSMDELIGDIIYDSVGQKNGTITGATRIKR